MVKANDTFNFCQGNYYSTTTAAGAAPPPPPTTTTTQTYCVISKLNIPDLNDSRIWFVKKTFNIHNMW